MYIQCMSILVHIFSIGHFVYKTLAGYFICKLQSLSLKLYNLMSTISRGLRKTLDIRKISPINGFQAIGLR